ncbi:hypothetical protein LSM04_002650 [Trypanosoma melophagium]|uniref:uncharacterized protein n=1 Tax=Trypanosoma melophagium TaxID=715481 RepID=UPI00351A76F1|nr:hypothetical protein LSM04_002650 [Trypanosoma melophagium]
MLTSLTRGFPQQQQQRETPVGADETELCELRRSTLLQDEELDKLRRAQKELNAQLGKLKHAKKDLERVREENVKLHAQLKERADSTKELEDLRQENKKLNAKLEELAHLRNELSDLRLLNDELRAQLERQPAELLVSLSPRGEGESRDEPLAEELIEVPRTRLVAVEEVAEAAGEAPREMLTSLTRGSLSSNSSGDPRGCGRDGALDKLRRAQKELNAQLGKLKHAKKDLERVREENVKLHAQLKERADSTKELEDLRQENKKLNAKLEELAHLRNELSDLRLLNDELRAQLERQPAELLVSLSPRGEGESRDEPLAEELIEVPRTRLVAVEEVAEAAGEAPREMLTSLTREFPQQQQQRETPVGAEETELCELRRSTLLQDEELDKLRRAQKELNAQLGKLEHAKKDLERVREENVKLHAQLKERADSTKELEDLRQENKKLNAKLEELAHLRNELSDLRLLNDELRAQLERQPAELLVSLSPRGEGESRDEPLAEELIEVPRTRLVAVEEVAEAAGEAPREMLTSLTREFPQQQQQRETPVGADETELCELRRSTLLQDEELDKLRRAQKELNAQLGKLKHAKKDLERVREENVKLHAQLKERADSTKELEDLRQENKKLNAKLEELAHLRNELSDLRLLNDELRAQLERQPAELLVSLSPRGEGESRDEPLAEELIEVPRTRLVAVEEVAEAAGEAPREMLTSLTREFPQQQQQRETPVGAEETELCELRRSTLLQDEELDKLRRAQKELNAQLGKLKHAKKDLERVREENVKLHAQLKERADSTKELEDLRQENKKLNAKLEELAHLRNELSDLRLLNDELRAQLERQPAELLVSLSPRGEGESRDEPLAEELIEVPRTRLVAVEEVAEAAGEAPREMLTSLTREFPQQQQQRETPVGADETELCELRRSTLLQDEELDKLRRAQKELNAQLGKLKHAKKDLERVREENVKLHAQLKERADSTKELEDLRQENKKLNAKLEELAHLRNELSDVPRTRLVAVEEVEGSWPQSIIDERREVNDFLVSQLALSDFFFYSDGGEEAVE